MKGIQMGTTEMAIVTNSYVSNFILACGASALCLKAGGRWRIAHKLTQSVWLRPES